MKGKRNPADYDDPFIRELAVIDEMDLEPTERFVEQLLLSLRDYLETMQVKCCPDCKKLFEATELLESKLSLRQR